jgi:diguanylate cyclase (GGDEF)-like protein
MTALTTPADSPSTCCENLPSGDARPTHGYLLQIHPIDLEGRLIPLSGDRFVLGVDPFCHLQLSCDSAQRFHAAFERDAVGFEVSLLPEASGLFVNHVRVQRAALRSGDRIQIGSHAFKFLSPERVEEEYEETLHSIRTYDGLTGLLNRAAFVEVLSRAACENVPAGLALFEIDDFQELRNKHGGLPCDEILQEVAQRLRTAAPEGRNTIARLGETLFGVLLRMDAETAAIDAAGKLRASCGAERIETNAGWLAVSLSGGIAWKSVGGVDEAAWLRTAEHQLKVAVCAGGRRLATGRLGADLELSPYCFA